jgi:hypothetical protein
MRVRGAWRSLVSARRLGRRGRRFESGRPDPEPVSWRTRAAVTNDPLYQPRMLPISEP